MKIFSKIYIVLLIGIFSCTEDMLEPTPVDTFMKFYGGIYPTEAIDAQVHSDGGLILLAASEAENDNGIYYFPTLIKVDQYGNKEWQISDESGGYIRPTSIYISSDNEYLVSGEMRVPGTDANGLPATLSYLTVQKATSSGFSQLFTTYEDNIKARGKAVALMSNGNIITIGEVSSGLSVKSIMLELSPDLNEIIWKKTFDDSKVSINNRVFENSNGRIYWAGTVQRTGNKAELIGATPRNLTEAKIEFPKTSGSITNNAFDFTSNEFLFLGDESDGDRTNMRFIKTSIAGNVLQNISITGAAEINNENQQLSISARSVSQSPSGAILALAEATDSRLGDFYLTEINSDGTISFSKVYGGTNRDVPAKVLRVNNGIMMFGHTNFADANTLVLIKTDVNGEF